MRKIMLLMSIICLTAMAAGCEENGMVVLMCEGGVCPEGSGSAGLNDSEPAKPDTQDSTKPTQQENPAPGTQDPTQTEKPGAQDSSTNNDPTDPKPGELCKANDDCMKGCVCPENQTCDENINKCTGKPTTGNPPSLGDKCREDGTCEDANKVCVGERCVKECTERDKCTDLTCGCRNGSKCQQNGMCGNVASDCGENGMCEKNCETEEDCDKMETCVSSKCVDKCIDKCESLHVCVRKYQTIWVMMDYSETVCMNRGDYTKYECNENVAEELSFCISEYEFVKCEKSPDNKWKWGKKRCNELCVEDRVMGAISDGVYRVKAVCLDY